MKYSYSLLPGLEKTGVLAPILPITFIHKKAEFPTFALIDSGAEQGLISTIIADELSINWRNIPKSIGYTTSGQFIYHSYQDIICSVDDYKFKMNINIAEGISPFKCILGRKDIFQKAIITFEGYKNVFYIEFRDLN
ncbi:MAG: hypothetical protein UV73_C0014G0029 [Candidatus Gottesmanbacteria bacterium GW2011_GWA2_43_14]|uniref:Peptidase A2 domain-containing protein n=1 Tax=Candidatus Gottesmanbacteria bacterium GW2011_GWA2_43_14 TaxID=1618443 RepID=A0A0G1DDR8_9BACT|nr:MAG: hypothetical protein UV73_C0014G0029 [Candidatus Gottesmanbacteria bacterium GW2011_GWA2_43_14]